MKEYHSRKFLNKKSGTAAVEITGSDPNNKHSLDLSVDISDCSRKISLDFYVWDDKSYKEKSVKIDTLIDEITKAKEWLDKAYPVFAKAKKEKQPKKSTRTLEEVLEDLES